MVLEKSFVNFRMYFAARPLGRVALDSLSFENTFRSRAPPFPEVYFDLLSYCRQIYTIYCHYAKKFGKSYEFWGSNPCKSGIH